MTELEVAASDWRLVVQGAELGRHPSIWFGHYRGHERLGDLFITKPRDEALAVLVLASPFAVSAAVISTFVFIDRPESVWVSRLQLEVREGTEYVRQTHWDLPYLIGDRFEISFGVATKRPLPNERIARAISDLADHRHKSGQYDFNDAFWHSIERGKHL